MSADRFDIATIEHATELVRHETARMELAGRVIGLLTALTGLATVSIGAAVAISVLLLR